MKKIKSKLVYINPSLTPSSANRRDKSASPDYKNNSKIQRTESPVKQVEQYYKIKEKQSWGFEKHYHSVKQQGTKGQYLFGEGKRVSEFSHDSNNLYREYDNIKHSNSQKHFPQPTSFQNNQNIDVDKLSQSIKLSNPSSSSYNSLNQQKSSHHSQHCYSKTINAQQNSNQQKIVDNDNGKKMNKNKNKIYCSDNNQINQIISNNHTSPIIRDHLSHYPKTTKHSHQHNHSSYYLHNGSNFTTNNNQYQTPKSNRVYLNQSYQNLQNSNLSRQRSNTGMAKHNYFKSANIMNGSGGKKQLESNKQIMTDVKGLHRSFNQDLKDYMRKKENRYSTTEVKRNQQDFPIDSIQWRNQSQYGKKNRQYKDCLSSLDIQNTAKLRSAQTIKRPFVYLSGHQYEQQIKPFSSIYQGEYDGNNNDKSMGNKQLREQSLSPSNRKNGNNNKKKLEVYSTPTSRKSVEKRASQQQKQHQQVSPQINKHGNNNNYIHNKRLQSKFQSSISSHKNQDPVQRNTIHSNNIHSHSVHQIPEQYHSHQTVLSSNPSSNIPILHTLPDQQLTAYIKSLQQQNINLKNSMLSKNKQIQKTSSYIKEYELLTQKNKMLQKQMSEVLERLVRGKRGNENTKVPQENQLQYHCDHNYQNVDDNTNDNNSSYSHSRAQPATTSGQYFFKNNKYNNTIPTQQSFDQQNTQNRSQQQQQYQQSQIYQQNQHYISLYHMNSLLQTTGEQSQGTIWMQNYPFQKQNNVNRIKGCSIPRTLTNNSSSTKDYIKIFDSEEDEEEEYEQKRRVCGNEQYDNDSLDEQERDNQQQQQQINDKPQQQEQSYKPNDNIVRRQNIARQKNSVEGMSNQEKIGGMIAAQNDDKKEINKNHSAKKHRRMLSVGARLKESLKANNQDFRAEFDQQTFLTSSSSIEIQQPLYNEAKSQQKVQIKSQTKAQQQNPPLQPIKTAKNQQQQLNIPSKPLQKNSDSKNPSIQLSPQQNNQTTLKKKPKYVIKSKNTKTKNHNSHIPDNSNHEAQYYQTQQKSQQSQQSSLVHHKDTNPNVYNQKNFTTLMQANKKLTDIIYLLVGKNQSNARQIKKQMESSQKMAERILKWEEDIGYIKLNVSQMNRVLMVGKLQQRQNEENLARGQQQQQVKGYDMKSMMKTLSKQIDQKIGKLFKSMNQNERMLRKQSQQRKRFLEKENFKFVQEDGPNLIKLSSFGKNNQIPNVEGNNYINISTLSKPSPKRPSNLIKPSRKLSGSQNSYIKQPLSPSFIYQQEGGSFQTESFKLSYSGMSNKQLIYSPSSGYNNKNGFHQYQGEQKSQFRSRSNTYNNTQKPSMLRSKSQSIQQQNLLQDSSSNGTSQFNFVQTMTQMQTTRNPHILNNNIHKNPHQNQSIRRSNQSSIQINSGRNLQKNSSENSEIRINFDDLYEDVASNKYQKFDIIGEKEDYEKVVGGKSTLQQNNRKIVASSLSSSQNTNKNVSKQQHSISLMKSSFGPIIINKQLSHSQKGDPLLQSHQNQRSSQHSHPKNYQHQSYHQQHPSGFHPNNPRINNNNIRPRQNSSINIWFSSDSIIGKTHGNNLSKNININTKAQTIREQQLIYQNQQNSSHTDINSIQPLNPSSHGVSASPCSLCQHNIESLQRIQTEANQMRLIISDLCDERDGLKRLIKNKVDIIDQLEIQVKGLRREFGQWRSKEKDGQMNSNQNQIIGKNISHKDFINQNTSYQPTSINQFYYGSLSNGVKNQHQQILNHKSSTSFAPSSTTKIMKQIQDVLPIASMLIKGQNSTSTKSRQRIESLRSIQQEIQEELVKQREREADLCKGLQQKGDKPIPWGTGSFCGVEQMREQSFKKTKAILLKLICLIRQFVQQNGGSV